MEQNRFIAFILVFILSPLTVNATVFDVTVTGGDSIWLAGRTDLTIPDPSAPWPGGMIRHSSPTPEEIKETFPSEFSVTANDVIKVLDPGIGGIHFFNGFGTPGNFFGPDGSGTPGSSIISSFGGISGYIGTQGALVGVFLDNLTPTGTAPATLDFRNTGIGVDFLSLAPNLAQVFYIGNGFTSGGTAQQFIAPTGATRLFVGLTDAFGFNGAPGAFDDNDGSYRIKLGINEDPSNPIPEPGILILLGVALVSFGSQRRQHKGVS